MRNERLERRPAERLQALEARELELHRDAGFRGRIDQRTAVGLDARGRLLSDGARRRRASSRAAWPQGAGIGVDTQHELRFALLHPRREEIAEGLPAAVGTRRVRPREGDPPARVFRPGSAQPTAFFRPLPALKRGTRDAAI